MHILIKILIFALVANTVSFLVYSLASPYAGAPKLLRIRTIRGSNIFSYFIAGNMNNASNVTRQLSDSLPGNIIAVDFCPTGYSPRKFIEAMTDHILTLPRGAEVLLFSSSLGTQPSQTLSHDTGLPLLPIDPCMNAGFLHPGWKAACYVAAILGTPVKYALGWLSYLPFPTKKPEYQGYSLATLVDQYFWIINYKAAGPGNIIGIARSKRDQIVRDDKVKTYFSGIKIVLVNSEHCNTEANANKYNKAIEKILRKYRTKKQAQDD